MFHPEFGSQATADVMKGSTLIIGSHGTGLSPHIGMDLYILNSADTKRLGFYVSENITPVVTNDLLTTEGQNLG